MHLYQRFATTSIESLRSTILQKLGVESDENLEYLLDLITIKSIKTSIDEAARPQVVGILRADAARLAGWLDQRYPTARMEIIEALTRTMLSLTVQ